MQKSLIAAVALVLTTGVSMSAQASAKELGKSLTPIGAIQAGNGSDIPEWKGGIKKPPKNYKKKGPLVMPKSMKKDKPVETITSENYGKFSDSLSEGHKKLFSTYKSYKMPVYESKRTGAYPKGIYKWTKVNAKKAKLKGTDSLKGGVIGFPFPLPHDKKSGSNAAAKIMWNHKVRYRGDTAIRANDLAIMSPSGTMNLTKVTERVLFFYGNVKKGKKYAKSKKTNNLLFKYKAKFTAPPAVAGQITLVHEFADQTKQGRLAWIAKKGDTKPTRAPTVGFDNPSEGTNGMQFNDQVDMYNGSFERYDWSVGKKAKEMYIAHNSYKGADAKRKYKDIMKPRHYNQSVARYEKQRVWVVTAKLKKGKTHTFGKRVFYVQEDCWCVAMVDNYDKNGTLYRFQEAHLVNFYFGPGVGGSPELTYDFKTGNYLGSALTNESKPIVFNSKIKDSEFTEAAVRRDLR